MAVLAIGLVTALAVGAAASDHYLPVESSGQRCWSCHSNWTPPVPTGAGGRHYISAPLPQSEAGAAVGQPFTYEITINNPWRGAQGGPELTFLAPALDLSRAPSLRFAGERPPYHNTTGLPIPPGTNVTEEHGATASMNVPVGATRLSFTVTPRNADANTGPDVRMLIRTPTGEQLAPVNAVGRGKAETYAVTPEQLQKAGSGTWRVTAKYTPVSSNDPTHASTSTQDFDVAVDAGFETTGLRIQAVPRTEFVGNLANTLQTWTLAPTALPAPGETVRIYSNVTAHYKHVPPVGEDWGNFTSYVDADVIDGTASGHPGRVLIVYKDTSAVRPDILNGATATTISEAVGYAAALLLISSILSGGMFGRASRRGLNHVFGSAKRRVAFHNFLSYGLTVAALVHMCIFVARFIPAPYTSRDYDITWGLTFGGLGILAMVGLGLTGALQVPMIRKWNYATWRWTHYGMTVAAILFTVIHILLDGRSDFSHLQESLGWKNQLFPFRAPS